ncbi:hypothetical protein FBY10_11238 [Pseudomonas sp. SJZ103]|nr:MULTISPECIES: hypothetical protein [unclassified Pseudomonas]MCS4310921.1 hypothetical protein [Pseudomonas sp. BIGb0381]NJJ58762.1 hypothetical protein [Pseudomonas sp. B14(2022)]TWC64350.1 hypothetical protein FBY10_11238 [Pseudomonas sp. SJZ103]TWC80934.1 hypothetical protein FBY08_11438 [Pseudomonas sp. SJZ094]
MAETSQSSGETKVAPLGISALEKAWDFHWAMRFVSVVLFLDIALLIRTGTPLVEWTTSSDALLADLGFLTVAAASFALVVSFVLPLLTEIVRGIGTRLRMAFPKLLGDAYTPPSRGIGYVWANDLLDLALKENSDFLLSWYQRHVQLREQHRLMMNKVAHLVFGCLVLSVVDWAVPYFGFGTGSLIFSAMHVLGDTGLFLASMVVVAGGVMLASAWFAIESSLYIYYPPLDMLQREQERKRYLGA